MRLILIWMGLRTDRTCGCGGRNLLSTSAKKASRESHSSGCHVQLWLNRSTLFLMKQYTLSDICMCSRMSSCCNLGQLACLCMHSGLCKMVPHHILQMSCWTPWNTALGSCNMSNHCPDCHSCSSV
jgi:hypothetical protein